MAGWRRCQSSWPAIWFAVGLLSVFVLAGADVALAQAEGSANPAIPNAAITSPPSAPREWSGEDGSSGHPEMKASAIRAAAANFENCLEHLWPLAAKRNISRASFDRHVKGLTPDLRIMDLMDAQPEFTKAFWDYLDILVSDARLARGREILAQYKPQFDAAERATGVDRYIIASIWGIESNFSPAGGERPVVRSTATLACVGRRQAYFRDEFLSALEILHRGDVTPDHLKGSWAGAFGPTQFMPTSFKPGTSSASRTALMPGILRAAEASRLRIFARACGEQTGQTSSA